MDNDLSSNDLNIALSLLHTKSSQAFKLTQMLYLWSTTLLTLNPMQLFSLSQHTVSIHAPQVHYFLLVILFFLYWISSLRIACLIYISVFHYVQETVAIFLTNS